MGNFLACLKEQTLLSILTRKLQKRWKEIEETIKASLTDASNRS